MKNSGDDMSSIPGGQVTVRRSLYPEDEKGGEELQGETEGAGQLT